jgi:hypothetical protein
VRKKPPAPGVETAERMRADRATGKAAIPLRGRYQEPVQGQLIPISQLPATQCFPTRILQGGVVDEWPADAHARIASAHGFDTQPRLSKEALERVYDRGVPYKVILEGAYRYAGRDDNCYQQALHNWLNNECYYAIRRAPAKQPAANTEWQKKMQVNRVKNQQMNREMFGDAAYLIECFEEGKKTIAQLFVVADRNGRTMEELKDDLRVVEAEVEGDYFWRKPVDMTERVMFLMEKKPLSDTIRLDASLDVARELLAKGPARAAEIQRALALAGYPQPAYWQHCATSPQVIVFDAATATYSLKKAGYAA